MKNLALRATGTIDTTLPATSDPGYQQAALSLYIRQVCDDLATAGFSFQAAETTDFTTYVSDFNNGMDDFGDRLDEILSTGVSTVVANLPDVAPIIGALLAGGGGAVIPILLNGVADTLLRHMNSRTTSAGGEFVGGDVDTTALETKLDEIEAAILQVLNEININVFRDEDTQTYSSGPLPD